MQLPRYSIKTDRDFLDFEFISEGPKGKIKKIIHFTAISRNLFNIGFGDLDELTGNISDIAVTNNNDSRKVLATVAFAIQTFIIYNPAARIAARGSTTARTRLYRMGITIHWEEISKDFKVYGLRNTIWEPFIRGREYESFLIHKK